MGKYSDALRKIEEQRLKKDLLPKMGGPSSFQKLKPYLVALLAIPTILVLAIFGYGLRTGMDLAKVPAPVEAPENIEIAPFPDDRGDIPFGDLTHSQDSSTLLDDIEQIAGLAYRNPDSEKPPAAAQGEVIGTSIPAPAPVNVVGPFKNTDPFYTIQLISLREQESARVFAQDLKDQGHEAFIVMSGQYFAVCIEKFADKAEANIRLAEIKNSPIGAGSQDAFIRHVKPKVLTD